MEKRRIEDRERVHAVKLTYRSAGRDISKRLLGYGPWDEVKAGKIYHHRSIRGVFQGTLVRKSGRACLIVPQELAKPVEETIVRYGGEIRSVVPVVMTKKMADRYYADYLQILMGLLRSACEADIEEDFKSAMKGAATLTKKFESLIEEASKYAEEKPKPISLHHIFNGMASISRQDFEAAKLQTEFLAKSVEEELRNLLKSPDK